jgi:hypothetical protein
MIRTPFLCLFLLACATAFGQFQFDFNDIEDLSQTTWKGDLQDFKIENNELRLLAMEAGNSFIYHPTNIPDSLELGCYFKMDFNPSLNNKLRIYIYLDTIDLSIASGYYVEIGENGNEDKISFVRLIEGDALTIAEGMEGKFATAPAEAAMKITRDETGLWLLELRLGNEAVYTSELELFDSTIKRYFNQYFAIECIYTSSRKDKFYFDNLYLRESVPDIIPPQLEKAKIVSSHTVELVFDEVLNKETARQKSNYVLVNEERYPDSIHFNEFLPNRVILQYSDPFLSERIYILQVSNISDLKGNALAFPVLKQIYLPAHPEKGDLIVNEILFNPFEEGDDYLEIFNRSNKIISLNGLEINNAQSNANGIVIDSEFDLFPHQYLVMSPDTNLLSSFYFMPDSVRKFQHKLPSFNNDKGNVSLYANSDGMNIMIDSFDYDESMHFELIEELDGLSLERIYIELDTNDETNWQSAASYTGGGTPGYQNSQKLETGIFPESLFSISEPVFSPDNDGFMDVLSVQYQMPEDGYMANVSIFNSSGYFITKLVNNHLLGTKGVIIWDGLNDDHKKNLIGPYILYCEVFHPDGQVFKQKMVAYLVETL